MRVTQEHLTSRPNSKILRVSGMADKNAHKNKALLNTGTSILHHAFISIFIALWAVIIYYISILMAILSYFTRFTMKRGNAGSWNFGWKRSKYWKPILHCSKNPETPQNLFLELIIIIERKKHLRGPTPWLGGWGRAHP